jgi:dienelactone hydrolase
MKARLATALVGAACAALVVTGTPAASHAAPISSGPAPELGAGRESVVISDVMIPVEHQGSIAAYIVQPGGPAEPSSRAGVLWLHWLGQIHSDRSEFLAEAVSLAGRGVVSVLPQGEFPWAVPPTGDKSDVEKVTRQVRAFHAALRRLEGIRGVDRSRLAIVGHDYGAMFGALVADESPEVSTLALEAPDAAWGNWFSTYWLGYKGQQRSRYAALFAGLNPVGHIARLGHHVLLQWAGQDIYVTEHTRKAYAARSPRARVILYPTADHQLTDAAQVDRDDFLATRLHLPDAAGAGS